MHVGLGSTALSFPWLFDTVWQVGAVCGLGVGILLAVRSAPRLRRTLGGALHDVGRQSVGELLFAAAIFLLFALGHQTPVRYVLPLAVLTVADTAAALVGGRWGRHRFAVIDGQKSGEGVVAFAVSSAVVTIVVLSLLTALNWPALLLIAITIALVGAAIEALAWRGLDNLLAPLGLYLTLSILLQGSAGFLLFQLAGLCTIILLGYVLSRPTSVHTRITAVVTSYALWLGGPLLSFVALLALLLGGQILYDRWDRRWLTRLENIPAHYWLAFNP
jgi:phytol kinase